MSLWDGCVLAAASSPAVVAPAAVAVANPTAPWVQVVIMIVGLVGSLFGVVWYVSGRLQKLETGTNGRIDAMEAATQSRIDQFETSVNGKFELLAHKLESQDATLKNAKESRRNIWAEMSTQKTRVDRIETVCEFTHKRTGKHKSQPRSGVSSSPWEGE